MTKNNSHINTNRLDFFYFVVLTDTNVVIMSLKNM